MKTNALFVFLFLCAGFIAHAGGYQVGDKATDFKLLNVDGNYVSLSDYEDAKGFVVVFTCNHCPYAIAYQDRLKEIDKEFKSQGYPVIAVNPNDEEIVPGDSYENMVQRAKDENYPFPYLRDKTQDVYKAYGAERTPHVYLLNKNQDGDLIVSYIGAIDDNYKEPESVKEDYLRNAIHAVMQGKEPDPSFTKAIGCTIKAKK